jgi:hypothetical protein
MAADAANQFGADRGCGAANAKACVARHRLVRRVWGYLAEAVLTAIDGSNKSR